MKLNRGLAALSLFVCAAASAAVPTPESHFGHKIGVDRVLLDWAKVVSYFQELPKYSDRIRVEEYGRTADGRPMIAATIADPATIRNLDRYKEIQRRLADPRLTSPAQAEPLFREGKNVVLMTCSVHATEVASTHSAVEFAYRLLTESNPRFDAILKNTILILVPSINPDGVDIVTQWYRKTLNTKWEGTSPPELYQKYTGHDNNRDWYIFSQPETRATISKLHNGWHPEIVYDVHQQGSGASRIFIPPWLDPIEPNIDPILSQEMNMIGTSMASDLTSAGKTGVGIHAIYDFWTPSRHYQAFHGGLRILTESASVKLATPITVSPSEIDQSALGYDPRARSWNYLEPWKGGTWRLRDIIDYQQVAFESLLYNAAIHREEMLRSFYKVAQHQLERTTPWGAVISANQADPGATRKMLETLAFGMVEISKAPNGDYVIPFQQPYSGWAKSLLEKQDYPVDLLYPGGPPKRPYDVTAHTLPMLFGVESKFVEQPVAGLSKVSIAAPAPATVYKASDSDGWKAANAAWKTGKPVWRNQAGDFAVSTMPSGTGWEPMKQPRVGLYRSFRANMDEGWTRWLIEEFGFAYSTLRNADIRGGGLRSKFDTIVFADETPNVIADGAREDAVPAEFAGGLGSEGADALKKFAAEGGTIVFLNRASGYAIQNLGVRAKNVLAGVAPKDFYCPGSLLNAKLDRTSPLAKGLPENLPIWMETSPAWETEEPAVMKYVDSKVLASGWLLGESRISGKTALIDAKSGSGHIILFGMRPQYRAQSYLTLKLFFNALVRGL